MLAFRHRLDSLLIALGDLQQALQVRQLVDEVTCMLDANHSLLTCIVFVYQKSERSLIFNYKKKLNVERKEFQQGIEPGSSWIDRGHGYFCVIYFYN